MHINKWLDWLNVPYNALIIRGCVEYLSLFFSFPFFSFLLVTWSHLIKSAHGDSYSQKHLAIISRTEALVFDDTSCFNTKLGVIALGESCTPPPQSPIHALVTLLLDPFQRPQRGLRSHYPRTEYGVEVKDKDVKKNVKALIDCAATEFRLRS